MLRVAVKLISGPQAVSELRPFLSAVLILSLAFTGCAPESDPVVTTSAEVGDGLLGREAGARFTLGDIDPIEPARRVRRLQPLADHLAERLGGSGYATGHVKVARDIGEMASLLERGEVDLFLDSTYPVLAVREQVGGTILLRRWAREEAEYWTAFVAPRGSGITSLDELPGSVIVFQEPHSTSGFFLPAATLLERGLSVSFVGSLTVRPDPGTIGAYFSGDEENTIQLLARAEAVAGVLSSQDLGDLPPALRNDLVELDRTASVARQLVLARRGLDPATLQKIVAILEGLTDVDREALGAKDPGKAWTWRFDVLTEDALLDLENLAANLEAVQGLLLNP